MVQFLLDKIVAPLVVVLLTPIIIGIASKINTGDWMKWFGLIPKTAWIIFGLFIFLWFILIRNRVKQLQELDTGSVLLARSSYGFGWIPIGKRNYAGVVWRVRAPATSPWKHFGHVDISPSNIEVETPPRCPKCETELEQLHSFWGGYIWKCVGCGFQKRNRDSYYKVAKRAEKIARREWEKQEYESSGV